MSGPGVLPRVLRQETKTVTVSGLLPGQERPEVLHICTEPRGLRFHGPAVFKVLLENIVEGQCGSHIDDAMKELGAVPQVFREGCLFGGEAMKLGRDDDVHEISTVIKLPLFSRGTHRETVSIPHTCLLASTHLSRSNMSPATRANSVGFSPSIPLSAGAATIPVRTHSPPVAAATKAEERKEKCFSARVPQGSEVYRDVHDPRRVLVQKLNRSLNDVRPRASHYASEVTMLGGPQA
ncbi:hypothetical protein EDB83DRAFT_2322778 [Lactarius deliciosus]|nr:hypothetical protein EDB83DRAFT_2322778 [Lactarius deliciosus]